MILWAVLVVVLAGPPGYGNFRVVVLAGPTGHGNLWGGCLVVTVMFLAPTGHSKITKKKPGSSCPDQNTDQTLLDIVHQASSRVDSFHADMLHRDIRQRMKWDDRREVRYFPCKHLDSQLIFVSVDGSPFASHRSPSPRSGRCPADPSVLCTNLRTRPPLTGLAQSFNTTDLALLCQFTIRYCEFC